MPADHTAEAAALERVIEPVLLTACRLNRARCRGVVVPAGDAQASLAEARLRAVEQGIGEQLGRLEPLLQSLLDLAVNPESAPEGDRAEAIYDTLALPGGIEPALFSILTMGGRTLTGEDAEAFRTRMLTLSGSLPGRVDADQSARLTPDAYDHTDTTNLVEPPTRTLPVIGVVFIVAAAVLVATNVLLYRKSAASLIDALDRLASLSEKDSGGEDSR